MNTQIIGIKDFRANISKYATQAQKGTIRYVVMNRNKPLFEIKPFEKNEGLESIFSEINTAIDDIKKGRLHTQEDILKEFS